MYGNWIYKTSPEEMLSKSLESKEASSKENDCLKHQKLLVQAVQFEAISTCLDLLRDEVSSLIDVETSSSIVSLDTRRETLNPVPSVDDEHGSIELKEYKLSDLKSTKISLRFEPGDPAWICSFDETGEIEGYLPVTVVGHKRHHDEVWYIIGHYNDSKRTVVTDFEAVEDCDVFEDIPKGAPPPTTTSKRKRRHLMLVS